MSKVRLAAIFSAVTTICFFAPDAHAQASRTWVSGVGDDANPCSRTAPCKTFAGAISKTAAKGEINTLDPGGFGAVTITKSITIDATAGLGGILAAGANGVIVNALTTDVIILRHLDINGFGTGLNGIRILAAGQVRVEDCKIFGFTGRGITDERTSGKLVVTDTMVSNNTQTGIVAIAPSPGTLVLSLDRVRMDGNANSGLAITSGAKATVVRSLASGNVACGFYADNIGGNATIDLHDSVASGNGTGIFAGGGGTIIRVSDTTVTGNTTGLAGSSILSYGNNRFDGNTGGNGPPTGPVNPQ
ncbi:MAG: right-handed parallel beta-helix repeat-containing protein [Thermoanaerobaculia bacterium]|nr:right-handed parallel beta-helix repeat-containing protein [Thermoanaerobaculia bacterium]